MVAVAEGSDVKAKGRGVEAEGIRGAASVITASSFCGREKVRLEDGVEDVLGSGIEVLLTTRCLTSGKRFSQTFEQKRQGSMPTTTLVHGCEHASHLGRTDRRTR